MKVGVRLAVFAVLLALCLGGCTAAPRKAIASSDAAKFYVMGNGWHTSIAIPWSELPVGSIRAAADFPRADFLVFGWGDGDFYVNRKKSPWVIFKAVALPTWSAMHVINVRGPLTAAFPRSEILEATISRRKLEQMCRALDHEFVTKEGKLVRLGSGFVGDSQFYLARSSYYVPNTCNVWTARILREGGLPLTPPLALVSDDLMWQTRKHTRFIQPLRKPGDPY